MLDARSNMTDKEFEEIYEGYFFEADLDGSAEMTLLCEQGNLKSLTRSNVDEYVELYLQKYT